MAGELADQMAKVALAEDDEVIQTFASHRLYEPFRMRVAIWTPRRNGHAAHAAGLEQHRPRLGEHRIPIVDQVSRVAQESVHRVEQISRNLLHPIAVRGNADPGDLHGAGLYTHDEEHHVADGPEHAQDFDAEEIACVQ